MTDRAVVSLVSHRVPEMPCVKPLVYVKSRSNGAWSKGFEKTCHPQGHGFEALAIERKTGAIGPSNSPIPIHDLQLRGFLFQHVVWADFCVRDRNKCAAQIESGRERELGSGD